MSQTHATLAPSSASRWLRCAASRRMVQHFPNIETEATKRGSVLHSIAEDALNNKGILTQQVGDTLDEYPNTPIDDALLENANAYVDFIESLSGEKFIEMRVDFSPWAEGGFGTADCIVVEGASITIIDLKGGDWKVKAIKNVQMMLYALGFYNEYGFLGEITTFKLMIFQPSINNVSTWEISLTDLLDWAENELKPAAKLAMQDDAPFTPGETQCQFCPAKGQCKAFADYNLEVALDGFESINEQFQVKENERLSAHDYAQILPRLKTLKKWIEAVESSALDKALAGETIDNYKVVEKITKRIWKDKEEAEKKLRNTAKLKVVDIIDRKLKSPAQVEKLLGKDHKLLKELVIKPKGDLTLAPLTDKRAPQVPVDPFSGFDNVCNNL